MTCVAVTLQQRKQLVATDEKQHSKLYNCAAQVVHVGVCLNLVYSRLIRTVLPAVM